MKNSHWRLPVGFMGNRIDIIASMKYNVLHGGDIMSFSIRLTENERLLAESYARLHSFSLSEAFKRALFEKIEDEYDIILGQEAYDEYIADQRKSRPVNELWKECDL